MSPSHARIISPPPINPNLLSSHRTPWQPNLCLSIWLGQAGLSLYVPPLSTQPSKSKQTTCLLISDKINQSFLTYHQAGDVCQTGHACILGREGWDWNLSTSLTGRRFPDSGRQLPHVSSSQALLGLAWNFKLWENMPSSFCSFSKPRTGGRRKDTRTALHGTVSNSVS